MGGVSNKFIIMESLSVRTSCLLHSSSNSRHINNMLSNIHTLNINSSSSNNILFPARLLRSLPNNRSPTNIPWKTGPPKEPTGPATAVPTTQTAKIKPSPPSSTTIFISFIPTTAMEKYFAPTIISASTTYSIFLPYRPTRNTYFDLPTPEPTTTATTTTTTTTITITTIPFPSMIKPPSKPHDSPNSLSERWPTTKPLWHLSSATPPSCVSGIASKNRDTSSVSTTSPGRICSWGSFAVIAGMWSGISNTEGFACRMSRG
mmetsp:Transcript_26437/g.55469  ORF Transcript_26437/g.55469 Transcript_26437/m.55469 type:complete len:261 (-) Transcript_26437:1257-2039(-)